MLTPDGGKEYIPITYSFHDVSVIKLYVYNHVKGRYVSVKEMDVEQTMYNDRKRI